MRKSIIYHYLSQTSERTASHDALRTWKKTCIQEHQDRSVGMCMHRSRWPRRWSYAVKWTHIPRGCLDSTGTETADSVSPLGASVSLAGCAKKRTSWGSGSGGVAFKPVRGHMQGPAGDDNLLGHHEKGKAVRLVKCWSAHQLPHYHNKHTDLSANVFIRLCLPHLSEDLPRCCPLRVSSGRQRVCIHKTDPLTSETSG